MRERERGERIPLKVEREEEREEEEEEEEEREREKSEGIIQEKIVMVEDTTRKEEIKPTVHENNRLKSLKERVIGTAKKLVPLPDTNKSSTSSLSLDDILNENKNKRRSIFSRRRDEKTTRLTATATLESDQQPLGTSVKMKSYPSSTSFPLRRAAEFFKTNRLLLSFIYVFASIIYFCVTGKRLINPFARKSEPLGRKLMLFDGM